MAAITKVAIVKKLAIASTKVAAAIVMATTRMDLIGQTAAVMAVLAELASPTTSCNDLKKITHFVAGEGWGRWGSYGPSFRGRPCL